MGNFKEDIVKTEAFVFDVDGVFTDGGITPFGDDFIRRYYAKDGYAVSYASKLGYKICIITGGRGKWLQERFERLRVTKIYADCADKTKMEKRLKKLREQLAETGEFEEQLHHLADQMIAIDLDDGVKINYAKFPGVLAKIK